jgi:hypothetical protein
VTDYLCLVSNISQWAISPASGHMSQRRYCDEHQPNENRKSCDRASVILVTIRDHDVAPFLDRPGPRSNLFSAVLEPQRITYAPPR